MGMACWRRLSNRQQRLQCCRINSQLRGCTAPWGMKIASACIPTGTGRVCKQPVWGCAKNRRYADLACMEVIPAALCVRLAPPATGTPTREIVRLALPPPGMVGAVTVATIALAGPPAVICEMVGEEGRLQEQEGQRWTAWCSWQPTWDECSFQVRT